MTDSKLSCISHLLTLNNMKYSVGLLSTDELFVKEEWLFSIHKNENDGYDGYEYNMKTNELKMSKKENEESEFISIHISDIESNCVIDISNSGMRWEGSCKNHSPFGHMCLMNELNELIYQGVMIGDKKECFGIEFYPDLGQIEYIGCYYNNERHGFGMLYDRKGELLYEGDWLCGSNEYERSVILKDIDNDRMVHSLIHELVIEEGVGNDYKGDLLLCGFAYLERVVVKKKSFQNLNCLKIEDNCILRSIEIEDTNREAGAFNSVRSLIISSNLIDD